MESELYGAFCRGWSLSDYILGVFDRFSVAIR